MSAPPFHSRGAGHGRFYAVAYVPGFYVPPSGKSRDKAFFVLNFSPSKGYTRFSVSTVSPKGKTFHYSCGTEELDSAEYMMLRAWREEGVPLHIWRFYPSASVQAAVFTNERARSAYEAARHRVAHLIYQARMHAWAEAQFPAKPLFQFDAAIPDPMVSTPEQEDIFKHIADG